MNMMESLEKILSDNWLDVYDAVSIEEFQAIDAVEDILPKEVIHDDNEA